jgi:hypothetical protein
VPAEKLTAFNLKVDQRMAPYFETARRFASEALTCAKTKDAICDSNLLRVQISVRLPKVGMPFTHALLEPVVTGEELSRRAYLPCPDQHVGE